MYSRVLSRLSWLVMIVVASAAIGLIVWALIRNGLPEFKEPTAVRFDSTLSISNEC